MVRTLRRHRPSQPHHPESAGHRHGSQTPRRDRQRSEAAARPLPALSGVALGRSAPAQYAQLVGRGSARTARQGLRLHRGRPRQSLQGASRPQFERKRPRQQMDRGRLSAQDVYLSGLLQGEPRRAGTRLADQQFRLGRCRSVLEKSRGHRRRYLRTQRLQAHQALPLQLSGRHQKQSERGVHDGRTDRSGRLERIFPLRLLGRTAGQRRYQRKRLRLDTPDGRAVGQIRDRGQPHGLEPLRQSGQQRHRLHDDQRSQILQSRGALRIGRQPLPRQIPPIGPRGQNVAGHSDVGKQHRLPDAPLRRHRTAVRRSTLQDGRRIPCARTGRGGAQTRLHRYGRQTGRIGAQRHEFGLL